MKLNDPVELIKDVGKETAKKLGKLGVDTVYDLLTYWPRRYDDYSQVIPISAIKPGTVTVKALAESVRSRRARRGLTVTEAVLRDETSAIRAVWFNQPYRKDYFKKNQEYYFSGLYEYSYNRYSLMNPTVEQAKEFMVNTARIVPIYRETKGLASREIRQMIHQATVLFNQLPESLPKWITNSLSTKQFSEAARQLHWPESQQELAAARERIGFEELFSYVLAGELNKLEIAKEQALPVQFSEDKAKNYTASLPFELTPDQKQAAWHILQDIAKATPMNRLLEGDVGSGKTVVAAFACYMAAAQGIQSALMAPTELLARQHAKTIADLLEPLGIQVTLLISGIKKPQKIALKENIKKGGIDIVIGTHALLQEDVAFHRLGLIIVDEQHRFGVKQRQKLVDKGVAIPHMLSMTATPIPRSLALTVYGELEISVIASKPKNRLPIQTTIWSPNSRPQLYEQIDKEIMNDHQVFVVCPLIDESDTSGLKSVTQELQLLRTAAFKHRRIGLLHGKLKEEVKTATMEAFAAGRLDLLVTTTVIEVGIDVPNASVILIEGADQFGLAQLHQLRGRVGRAEHPGYCYLIPSSSQKPSKRLRAMETTNDGFKLAELDLKLRGPGAMYGTRQHGKLDLKIASITDTKLIEKARLAAKEFIKKEDINDFPPLAKRVEANRSLTYLN